MPNRNAPRLRGAAVALFSVILALAAHGAALDTGPRGGSVALLAVLCAGIGALVSVRNRAGVTTLFAALSVGQLAGHPVLSMNHHHEADWLPTPVMLAAHLGAVLLGAVLVSACERCHETLSRSIRGGQRVVQRVTLTSTRLCHRTDHHCLQHELLLAASISHRGPPARSAR